MLLGFEGVCHWGYPAQGEAPAGMEFIDVEEEYVVDEAGNGAWVPVAQLQPKPAQAGKGAKKGKGAKAARSGAKAARSGSPEGPEVEEF
jgi:hypothetical protein